VTGAEVATVLAEIAMLSEVLGENPFRARAFAAAARALEGSGADLDRLAREDALTTLPGVGEGIASTIRELVLDGRSGLYDRLREQMPVGLYEVMRVPGLGPKRAHTLHTALGVDSLDALEAAARAGKVAALPGFGAKTEAKVLEGIAFARSLRGRRRYPAALEVAVRLLEWLRANDHVSAAEIAGDVRRRMEIAESVDLVAASDHPAAVLAGFRSLSGVAESEIEARDRACIVFSDGLSAHLHVVPPKQFVAAVVVATGSGKHVSALQALAEEKGFTLDATGLRKSRRVVELADEEALYGALGLAYVPPELREDWGEVEAAAAGRIPRLVEMDDLRGTFHCHTTYSDGKATVAEMAEAARERGWQYLGLGDHSKSAGYAGGLSPAAVRKQHREIDAWNCANGGKGEDRFRIFKGIESDILSDGSLDYDDDVLASFDYVVGSVHSAFGLPERKMTDRIIRAVRNPHITILGHATGRLLLSRGSYAVDVRAVIDAAAEHGVAVEINADPVRLDLDWRHVRYAGEKGVLVPIDPDAHSTRALGNVAFGVNVARKGWLTAPQVLNTWTLEEVEEHFGKRKQQGAP
jgi:DNA polymerase (family 10)